MASVWTDLDRSSRSSTILAVCGSSSLTQAPDLPCCLNLKIDGATGSVPCPDVIPVIRCPIRIESGKFDAAAFLKLGFVIEEIEL